MQGVDAIPVHHSPNTNRVKNSRLPNGAAPVGYGRNLKLQPGAAGQLHFGLKPQDPPGF